MAVGIGGILAAAGAALAASLVARMLAGAGIALVAYQGVSALVDNAVGKMAGSLGGMAADAAQILSLAGVGEAFDVVLSTIAGAVSVVLAGRIVGFSFGGG